VSAFVDWGLASRLARVAAGGGPAAMARGAALEAVAARAREAVLDYTGLDPSEPVPAAEWVSRREWAAVNLASMRSLVGPLEEQLSGSLPEGRAGRVAGAATGGVMAAEVAGVLGLASRRVLGQYEFPLGGGGEPRLLLVGQNLEAAAGELRADPAELLEWVTLHEMTHAVHFSAAPWLRDHLAGLVGELLAETPGQLSLGSALAGARRMAGDPRRLIEELRESDPVMLLAPAASRPRGSAASTGPGTARTSCRPWPSSPPRMPGWRAPAPAPRPRRRENNLQIDPFRSGCFPLCNWVSPPV
jgi:putative hydrolase